MALCALSHAMHLVLHRLVMASVSAVVDDLHFDTKEDRDGDGCHSDEYAGESGCDSPDECEHCDGC